MAPPVRYCIPSERLCNLEEGSPRSSTYTQHGYIFSSLAGCLTKTSENGVLPVVSVMRETESQLLPDVGAVITCKVFSINSHFAKVHILYVGSTPLKNAFRGTIRKEDIRATEKDKPTVNRVSRWFPSAGVRCSAPRPTQKNSGKWPGYSLSSYKPKYTSPQRRSHLFPRVPV
ncbi:exosome complex component CSL4-like isoform X2 [Microtus oregoni]|uniref:exosome complex component CSL4-like isoform X2 n=1 Tax=Microtus oregoni TaxID=111838 RepID=UPI001BB207CE|nr:exosome complex component CSL4-like isoform X2 [Microtus oregoni]